MSENLKHIIALVLLLALAGGFYYFSQNDTFFKGHQKRAKEIAEETVRLKKEVIAPLQRLDNVRVNVDFFKSAEYRALNDSRDELRTPDLYRENPFEPVSFVAEDE